MKRALSADDKKLPSYGALGRYTGEQGSAYFQHQSAGGILAARFNEFIYKPYVSHQDDVLEFGCGGGYLLHVLNAKTKIGVDINPSARAEATDLGISVYATLDEIEGQRFSRVITSHALEHVPDPFEALRRLRDFLRPDGLLIWLSPMDDWRTKGQRQWKPDDRDMHIYAWTPLSIGNILCAAGYKPESISVLTHAFPPALISKNLWNIHPSLFHVSAYLWSAIRKQRQLLAIASPAQS